MICRPTEFFYKVVILFIAINQFWMNCIPFMETPKRLGNRIEMFVMTVTMITWTWMSSESTNEADWSTRWLLCTGTLLVLQVLLQIRLQVQTRIWSAVQTLDAPLPVHIVTTVYSLMTSCKAEVCDPSWLEKLRTYRQICESQTHGNRRSENIGTNLLSSQSYRSFTNGPFST